MTSDGRADCTHDRRCYALILLATFASPRRGEATALRRCDLDLDAHVRVRPAYAERSTGEMLPVLYLPRPTGVAPHSPWHTLAADTNLGDLQEDILAAMRGSPHHRQRQPRRVRRHPGAQRRRAAVRRPGWRRADHPARLRGVVLKAAPVAVDLRQAPPPVRKKEFQLPRTGSGRTA